MIKESSDSCGLFGKVPQQADFVSHFLPTEFTDYWHGWLQSSLSVSHEQLGEHWLDYYLTSPVWRFAIMPDIATQMAITGVLVPSVDEVGRYYPVTVAHLGYHQPWSAYLNGQQWYQSLQDVALFSLDDTTNYTQLMEKLEALTCPDFPTMPSYRTQASSYGSTKANSVFELPAGTSSDELAISLIDKAYQRLLGNYSLWWTDGSDCVDASLLMSSGLPEAGQFAAMLDGNWQQWGWSQELVNELNNNLD
jgi:type VI secretion system protein ImpM